MIVDNINQRKIILKKFLNSSINITPSTLDFILELDNPLKKVNLIIKNTSFLPDFNSHITGDILKKISNKEIQEALKRITIKEDLISTKNDKQVKEDKMSTDFINQSKVKDITIESSDTNQKFSEINNNILLKKNTIDYDNDKKDSKTLQKKYKVKIKPIEGSKSTLAFKPIAKEYDPNYNILKDPTGKLYTNGAYQDFYNLMLDKFNKLRNLMRKRSEVLSASNVNNILRLSNKAEVSVVGFVNNIRETKNKNFFLTLEDLTGYVNGIIRRDTENSENIKIAEKTLLDQMVYIEGTYNPGERGKSGIIFCKYITNIDIPKDYIPNKSKDPLSIALISDCHIGSKEFEEKLWKRFTALLNGKIGNKGQRERAGRIKYIIINGDLVDGIGVYPNQNRDLTISDIYKQFKKASEIISIIPDYIKIFYSSGNHEPVRNAIPRPAVPKKYSEDLINYGVEFLGNPTLVQTHDVITLAYHGDSILDLNMSIPGLENDKPVNAMVELLKGRHLAPTFGKKTQIAPINKDWLVIDKIPDIFHTGHIHINGMDYYNNIVLVNSGCFQSQTDFMESIGIRPTPGILSIVDLDTLKGTQLDLKTNI